VRLARREEGEELRVAAGDVERKATLPRSAPSPRHAAGASRRVT